MNEFMKILLSLSVSGTLLFLLIRGLKPLYQNRFCKRWQYYIWLAVALRFLLPFTPDTTIVGNLFGKISTSAITNSNSPSLDATSAIDIDFSETEQLHTNKRINSTTTLYHSLNIYVGLFFVWSVLALVFLIHKIILYHGFIQYIRAGNTDKTIIETEYCMLAYNANGSPLKLYWNFLDNSAESSYKNVVRSKENILSGQTEDYRGGWSLYDGELMENFPKVGNDEANQVAYSLFCLKQVVFEDGSVWSNPSYENWLKNYTGKEIEVDELQNYYPHEYKLQETS